MAEFPAMPVWTDAYLADCGHLTTIEHGAYILLLFTMWRNDGWLENDDAKLARYSRLTTKQWGRIRPTIMAFFQDEGDRITQRRLTDELSAVRQKSRRQSHNSRSRWLKTKETPDATAQPRESHNDASLNPYPITHNPLKQEVRPNEFDRIKKVYPKRGKGTMGWAVAEAACKKLVKGGVSWGQLVSASKAYASAMAENKDRSTVQQASTFFGTKETWREYLTEETTPEFPVPQIAGGGLSDNRRAWRQLCYDVEPATACSWFHPMVLQPDGSLIAPTDYHRSYVQKNFPQLSGYEITVAGEPRAVASA